MQIEHLAIILAIVYVAKQIWDIDTEHAVLLASMKRHGMEPHGKRQNRDGGAL